MPKKTPPIVPTVPQPIIDKANITKAKQEILEVVVKAVNKVYTDAGRRLKKVQVLSYYATGGKVYLQLASGISSASFDEAHIIEGIGLKGMRGRIENDFSFQSGSTVNIQYNVDAGEVPLNVLWNGTTKKVYAYVWEQNSSLSSRPDITKTNWENLLSYFSTKKTPRKVLFTDLPKWNQDTVTPKTGEHSAPVSYYTFGIPMGWGGGHDDIYWYDGLRAYNKFCGEQLTAAKKAASQAAADLASAKADSGQTVDKTNPDGSGKTGKENTTTNTTTDTTTNSKPLGIGDDRNPVIYNLPAVKDMYFRDDDLQNFKVEHGNLSARINEAKELWKNAGSYKGMIQSYIVPAALDKGDKAKWWSPDSDKNGIKGPNKRVNTRRYGFQFQYNPSTVTMSFAGAPQVDIGLEISGADKVPLIGSSVTSSQVRFSLLINRMNDFKYINSMITVDSNTYAVSLSNKLDVNEIYSHVGNHPLTPQEKGTPGEIRSIAQELLQIKKLGTMYDIEYLLRTLLGYQLLSNLRNVYTSDVGYLGAYPVELHLGKNLRYLGVIDGFNVSHTIFNRNMVPVFSNIEITFSRLPDFAKPITENLTKPVDTSKIDKTGNA
jgi:hypothetical protein